MLPQFDRSRLIIKPLKDRVHDLSHTSLLYPEELPPPLPEKAMADLAELGRRLAKSRERGASVLALMGAHVLRAGVQRQLIDLMERGLITHIGMNGAGPIHDYELSRIGATCESVARYIRTGEFGLWRETGEINDIVRRGAAAGMGLGESIGKAIHESDFAFKDTSVLAAGYRLRVPVTVHVGIGYDIIHEHPNFDPAAFGTASYRDFLAVCNTVSRLEGGVFLCLGSAVMGPEVFLKALSMARNVAHQDGRMIARFTTAAFDLIPIEGEWHEEAPKSNPQYYYRPWKTILVRTVADGGEGFYICGDHRQTVPHLRQAALAAMQAAHREVAAPVSMWTTEAGGERPFEQVFARRSERAVEKKAEPSLARRSEGPPVPVTEVIPARKYETEVTPKLEPTAPQKFQATAAQKLADMRKPQSADVRKPQSADVRKPEAAAVRKAEATAAKKPEVVSAKKVDNTAAKRIESALSRKSDASGAKRPEFAAVKRAETPRAAAQKSETAPLNKKENAEGAVSHYLQLKDWVRANDATDLEWFEAGEKEGWHYSTITKESYLKLFYRIVWTSGFKSRVVLDKEAEYFRVMNEVLYLKKHFQPQRQGEFLMKVASVLGGSGDNRKNKAVFHVIQLVESLGWEEYRGQYVTPHSGLAAQLQRFPMLGPKTVKLLLQQLGISDSTKDDPALRQFAVHHGFGDDEKCVREIGIRTGDAPTTIHFVLWDAGQKDALMLKT